LARSCDVKSLLAITRPANSAMVGLAVLVGSVVGTSSFDFLREEPGKALLGFAAGCSLAAASMVLNDVADVEVDKVNAPHRPIPSGRVTIKCAMAFFALLSALGLAAAAATGPLTLLIALSSLAAASAYNLRLKKLGFVGNLVVSYNVAVPVLYGSVLAGRLGLHVAPYFAMIFLANTAREVSKGIVDVEGDKARGVMTVSVRRGCAFAARLASLLYALAIALSPLPLAWGLAGEAYAALVAAADAGFAYCALLLLRSPEPEAARRSKNLALLFMGVGLLAFAASPLG